MGLLGALCLSHSNAVDFMCDFNYFTDIETSQHFDYTCINIQELPVDSTITKAVGVHKYRDKLNTFLFTNLDVEIVEIYSESLSQIPKGLIAVFPKLSKLFISPKLQIATRSDFAELKQLKKLEISIDDLPANIFDDLVNLTELTLENSELTFLPNMVFQKMIQLEILKVVGGSTNRKIKELPANLFQSNLKLKDIAFRLNGLTCIRDGLLNGLIKLESLTFDNTCIRAEYPTVDLSVINDNIRTTCQSTCIPPSPVFVPVTPLPPTPVVVPVTPLPPTPVVVPLTPLPPTSVVVPVITPQTPCTTVKPNPGKETNNVDAAVYPWNPLVSIKVVVNEKN